MASETHIKRIVSESDVPSRLLKKIKAQSKGDRLNRNNFIGMLLLFNVTGLIFYYIINWIATSFGGIVALLLGLVGVAGFIILVFFNYCAVLMRCHDLNHSGWFILILFIPYVNIIFALYLILMKGSNEDNDYGSPDD